ncbi:MAG TPA: AAA family ATPase [Ktedonobacterales bacterium]|nr:AAA family ATPase [Ktedonobacterales bacterium]
MAAPHSAICPRLIGRAAYLESVSLLLGQMRQGNGHTLLLAGEAGIGKSRLIAEIKTGIRRDTALALQGNCFEPDRSLPYGPLIDALRALLAVIPPAELMRDAGTYATEYARLLPELAAYLPADATAPLISPKQEKRRLFEALVQLLTRLGARQPLLFVAEDIHWADDTSLEFLAFLARRLPRLPILLLLTYRSDEQHTQLRHFLAQLDRERLASEIALAPLTPAEVEEMLVVIFELQRPVRREFLDAMYNLTEGNPFFIEEVLHALLADDEIYYSGEGWERRPLNDLHIPRSVQDAVRRRSEHLSGAARRTLTFAAVVGQRFEFALLQHLTGWDEAALLDLLKELIAAQLVVEQSAERFAFRHALTRQAVYSELLERERRTMHRTIAATMEALYVDELESHLSELAYHTCQAGEWARSLEYARRAGERALALYAPHAALEQFTQAVTAAHHLGVPVAPAIYQARASAHETLGDFEHARSDLEIALTLAHEGDDTATEWDALLDLGLLWAGRDYAKTGEYYERALALAETLDEPLKRARTLNRLANWHLNMDEPQTAKSYHREALTIFETTGDARGVAETLDLLCMTNILSDDLMKAMSYGQRAVDMLRALDDRQPLSSSLVTLPFVAALRQSQTMTLAPSTLSEATRNVEEGLRIAREMGWRAGEANARWVLGLCMTSSGEFGRGVTNATAALAIADDIAHRQWMSAARYVLGELAYELYALSLAREHLENGLALAQSIGSWHWIRLNAALLAATHVAQGDLVAAETVLDMAIPPGIAMQTVGQRLAWVTRGELALAQGKPDVARDIARRLAGNLTPTGQFAMPLVALLYGKALTALSRYDEAEAWLRAATPQLQAQGARTSLRRALTHLAALYQHMGRADDAARSANEARELAYQLAETIPDAVLRAVFLRQSLASLPTEPKRSAEIARAASLMLTAREREVAALVAQGKSNRAIADELVISERTTESHVTNILGKLGFSSRAQIAAWAVDIGLTQPEASKSKTLLSRPSHRPHRPSTRRSR